MPLEDAIVLGGFIDGLAEHGYIQEFVRSFSHLRCRREPDNLIRYWSLDGKPVSKADRERVFHWHTGYRSALRSWRPKDY